jgi:hypothetical protein
VKQAEGDGIATQAVLRKKLKRMVVKNDRQDMLEQRVRMLLEETRLLIDEDEETARASSSSGTAIGYTELNVMRITGPSGSTKTTSMITIAEKLKREYPGTTPVLVVKCRSGTTSMKALQALILQAFGDPQADKVLKQFHDRYSQDAVTASIRKVARDSGTYILVLDESHTPIVGRRSKREWAMTLAPLFKSLTNDGLFAVIVMGTDDALLYFQVSDELNNRLFDAVSLAPVNLLDPSQHHYFFKFVGRIDRQMVRDGIVDAPVGLIDDVRSRAMTYDLAQGIPGTVSRVLAGALRISQRENRRIISWDDIRQAFWIWKGEQVDEDGEPIAIYDPWLSNPREATLEAIRDMSKRTGG